MKVKDGNNTLTYVLPDVVDPPETICVTLHIPNNKYHIMAFRGAIWDLALWWNWERDQAHTAAQVARVWKRVFASMQFGCPEIAPTSGSIGDSMPFFREVEDQGVCYLEFECCPDQWVRLARADQVPAGGQPGANTGGNPPPGGTKQTCAKLLSNERLMMPFTVNSGDQLTLDSCEGSAWDGVEGTPLGWFRLGKNGDRMFAGLDVGTPVVTGTDPAVTANHMSIIAAIGTAPVYVALPLGTPVTVPTVPLNSQVAIQVNDTTLSNNQGSEDICVTVKNNGPTSWTHTFDFTFSDGGFAVHNVISGSLSWIAGQGWVFDGSSGLCQADINHPPSSACTITNGTLYFDYTASAPDASSGIEIDIPQGTMAGRISPIPIASGQTIPFTGSFVDTNIEIAYDSHNTPTCTLTKLVVSGSGVDPF